MGIFKRKAIIYTTCEEIPIYNFFKLMGTNDTKWIVKKEGVLPKNIDEVKEDLFDEYVKLSKDNNVVSMLQKRAYINNCNIKVYICSYILNRVLQGTATDILVAQLKKWQVYVDFTKDVNQEVRKALQGLKAIKNEVKILEKDLTEETDKEIVSIDKQAVLLSRALDLKFQIDTKDTTAVQWLTYKEMANDKAKVNERD